MLAAEEPASETASGPQAVIVADRDGVIRVWNAADRCVRSVYFPLDRTIRTLRAIREGEALLGIAAGQQAFALLCVAVATALRYLLGLLWPDILVFPTCYPAVLIAALACGVPAGITATLLGAATDLSFAGLDGTKT